MEIDGWIGSYKVRAFPWGDGKRIYFNVQYYRPDQSIEKPPVWDKTVYVTDDEAGQRLVFNFTHSLTEYVASMQIPDNIEMVITVQAAGRTGQVDGQNTDGMEVGTCIV